jgi:hypothetical protein
VAGLGDDKVDVVGRGSNLRRASAYSGLLREGIRGLHDGNSLRIAFVCVSLDDLLARRLDNNMCLSSVPPRSVTSGACTCILYICICMYVPVCE